MTAGRSEPAAPARSPAQAAESTSLDSVLERPVESRNREIAVSARPRIHNRATSAEWPRTCSSSGSGGGPWMPRPAVGARFAGYFLGFRRRLDPVCRFIRGRTDPPGRHHRRPAGSGCLDSDRRGAARPEQRRGAPEASDISHRCRHLQRRFAPDAVRAGRDWRRLHHPRHCRPVTIRRRSRRGGRRDGARLVLAGRPRDVDSRHRPPRSAETGVDCARRDRRGLA